MEYRADGGGVSLVPHYAPVLRAIRVAPVAHGGDQRRREASGNGWLDMEAFLKVCLMRPGVILVLGFAWTILL